MSLLGVLDAESLINASLPADPETIFELLYQGKSGDALLAADRYIEANPQDPLPCIIKARVLRESLPEQDDNKNLIRNEAAPIHDLLDKAIELSKKRAKTEKEEENVQYYLGWAWMFKAQLHALGGSYWSAGRAASKGNKHLKNYLSAFPDDPDAKGLLGTFLYFADTLPTVVKVIKKLFLIPGGNREKGLEYLEFACSHKGLLTTDHRIIYAAIHTIFEGRFEEGVREFTDLLDRYPDYLRLVEPLGIVATFYPGKVRQLQSIENSVLSRHMQKPEQGVDWDTIYRLRYHRSYSYMFFETPFRAISEFTALIDEDPERPDWLIPLSLVNLGCLYANSGRTEEAVETFERVLEDRKMKHFHDIASKMLDNRNIMEGMLLAEDGSFIHSIYFLEQESAEAGLERYHQQMGANVLYDFYSGEAQLLAGDLEEASSFYQSALDRNVPSYSQAYQMLAAVRMAEIVGTQGNYRAAVKYLDKALDFYHKEFLADMLIEGRKRFYERLCKGQLSITPSLLVTSPPPSNTSKVVAD